MVGVSFFFFFLKKKQKHLLLILVISLRLGLRNANLQAKANMRKAAQEEVMTIGPVLMGAFLN